MKKYVKIYMNFFGYCEQDFIPSEVSGSQANNIHHIKLKSQCGKDNIENLIALTSEEHDRAHRKLEPYLTEEELQEKHNSFIKFKKNA